MTVRQTEIGAYPSEWAVTRVDELFDIQQGKQVSKRNRAGDNQRPFLRTRNVFWGQLDLADLDEMHFSKRDEEQLALCPGDLLLCEGGAVGRTAIWDGEVERCYYQNHLHRLRAKQRGNIDPFYAMNWFWYAFEIGNVYFGRGNVTTIPNLSRSRLSELLLPKPHIEEQRKIAYVLGTVQRAIEQQTQLIERTQELKRALMHKLFTEGTRGEAQKETEIGRIPQSWEIVRFSQCVSIKNGQVDPTLPAFQGLLHVGSKNIESDTGELIELKTNAEEAIKSGNYYFTSEDVLYSKIRPYLNKVALPDFEGTCSADMYPLRPKIARLRREFLFNLLLTPQFLKQAISFQDRTGIPKINRNQLGSVMLPIPDRNEQDDITKILFACDTKRQLHRQKLKLLEELFATLLHKLMTAQIRVNDLALPLPA